MNQSVLIYLLSGLLLLLGAGSLYAVPCDFKAHALPKNTTQIIEVHFTGLTHAQVFLCSKVKHIWQPVSLQAFPAQIGHNGVIKASSKREGDGKTPLGLFPIEMTFGTSPQALHMDYRYITPEDYFIDEPTSKAYNTWKYGAPIQEHHEKMNRSEYALGAVVGYNQHPVIAGKGSAIFLHIWHTPTHPTTGCVALTKRNVLTILKWLNKNQHPYIYIH